MVSLPRTLSSCSSRLALVALTLGSSALTLSAAETETTRITGMLVSQGPKGLLVRTKDGRNRAILIVRGTTEVNVLVPGNSELAGLLRPRSWVLVSGDAIDQAHIEKARITVYFRGRPKEQSANARYYYHHRAVRGEGIPVTILGSIVGTDPLRIRGDSSITSEYYFEDEVDKLGTPTRRRTFPTANKVFELAWDGKDFSRIQIDLGDARQLAGTEAHVTAYIDNRTEEARSVFISRRSPITLEELGIKKKQDRKRRSRRRSKK